MHSLDNKKTDLLYCSDLKVFFVVPAFAWGDN